MAPIVDWFNDTDERQLFLSVLLGEIRMGATLVAREAVAAGKQAAAKTFTITAEPNSRFHSPYGCRDIIRRDPTEHSFRMVRFHRIAIGSLHRR